MTARLTQEQVDRIVELREARRTYAEIAAEIGCSKSAVEYRCLSLAIEAPGYAKSWDEVQGPVEFQRAGHVVRRFTPDEDARLIRLERHKPVVEIARELKRKPHTIRCRLMTLARRDERRAGL